MYVITLVTEPTPQVNGGLSINQSTRTRKKLAQKEAAQCFKIVKKYANYGKNPKIRVLKKYLVKTLSEYAGISCNCKVRNRKIRKNTNQAINELPFP